MSEVMFIAATGCGPRNFIKIKSKAVKKNLISSLRYDDPFQVGGHCVTAQYSLHGTLEGVQVVNTKFDINDNLWESDLGRAVVSFPDETPVRGLLNVTFPDTAPTPVSNYWILRTDYFDYAVVTACIPINGTHHRDLYWFLSRGYPASTNARNRADELVDAYFNRDYIWNTRQGIEDCFGRPPPVPAVEVTELQFD